MLCIVIFSLEWSSQDQYTPLHIAASRNDTETVSLLLMHGASMEAKSYRVREEMNNNSALD